jgi:DNA-binding IclR family transcriptional regulator
VSKKRQPEDAAGDAAGVVKSAARVFEVLTLFAERRQPLTIGDIVMALSFPQSSASALLKSMTKLGYLSYDRHSRKFVPTVRIALLGGWVHDELFSPKSLSRLVDDLHAACGKHVVLGMQNDIYVQYIHLVQPAGATGAWYLKPGSLRPLLRAAVGKVLLSYKSDVDVLLLVRRINAEEADPANRVNPSALIEELDVIRRQGFAVSQGQVIAGRSVLAVPLPTPPSQPRIAIGIGGTIEDIVVNRDHYLNLLREALSPFAPFTKDTGKGFE